MRILVTGATGLIGGRLCRELTAQGHEIVFLSRSPENFDVAPGAKGFRWDPLREHPPIESFEGVDAVIHLAGESVAASRWTDEQKRRIRDSRVTGTRNLVDRMKELADRPRIFISASAAGFYGDRGDEVLDETAGPGEGFLSDICREWEAEAVRAEEIGLRVAIIRIGVVLSKQGGALEKMLLPFRLGLGGRLGKGRQWFPWIHLDDMTGIIRHALLTGTVSGPVNGVAPGIVRNEDFTTQLAGALSRPVFFPVPEFALDILMGEMAEVVLASQRMIPKVASETGYQFKFPSLNEALKNLLGN